MITLRTENADATLELGRRIGRRLPVPAVVGLDGDLGAGKTWMAKGLVQGVGEFEPTQVKSPAYNLVHEYRVAGPGGPLSVLHLDFYRLESLSDTDFLLFSEYFERRDVVCLVEWANRFLADLVDGYLSVRIERPEGGGEDSRTISVRWAGGGDRAPYSEVMALLEREET